MHIYPHKNFTFDFMNKTGIFHVWNRNFHIWKKTFHIWNSTLICGCGEQIIDVRGLATSAFVFWIQLTTIPLSMATLNCLTRIREENNVL